MGQMYETNITILLHFNEWKGKLKKEYRGDLLMYDVPNHYKWLLENELLNYFINNYCIKTE